VDNPGDWVRDREGRYWQIVHVRRLAGGMLHDVRVRDFATGYEQVIPRREFWTHYFDADAEAAGEEFGLAN
jgi:hypothetical protein